MSNGPVPNVRLPRSLGAALVLAAAMIPAAPARGQDADRLVQTHGFGTVVYGKTDHNDYAVGGAEGDYEHGELSLVVLAQPDEKLMIATNVALEQTHDGVEAALDYAFAEWTVSDAVRLRAGRVKQPFGLYTETFDVGTLRPFTILPQSLYGPAGFVSEGFDGLSLTGRIATRGGWAFAYDAYAGSIAFSAEEAREADHDGAESHQAERIRNTVGARVNVETPVSGLVLGLSAYTGEEDEGRHSAGAVHFEYLSSAWSLRSELARRSEDGGHSATAFYAEAARKLGRWQVALRHDRSNASEEGSVASDSFERHRDNSVGVNYWFSPNFVLKLSYHRVEGNRFAHPEGDALLEALHDQGVPERTDMVAFGAQFSF